MTMQTVDTILLATWGVVLIALAVWLASWV